MVQAIIILLVLVFVHELGHFLAAKILGVKVEEFGFGIPPRAIGKKIGETIYSLNWLPIGGFVKLFGEEGVEGDINSPNQERSFWKKSIPVRMGIVVAGVVMNFLLAVVAFGVIYSFAGIPKETNKVTVIDISANSPAGLAGLAKGDVVAKVDNEEINSVEKFIRVTNTKKGNEIALEINRNGDTLLLKTTPRKDPPQGEGPLGVSISSTEIYFPPVWQRPFVGIYYGFGDAILWSGRILGSLRDIFNSLLHMQAPQGLAGPVVVVGLVSETSKSGILPLINMMAILSVNLALFNILPIPALDGGKLLFLLLEAVFGRRILPKAESIIHTVGLVLLITLIIAITAKDLSCVVSKGGLSECIQFLSAPL